MEIKYLAGMVSVFLFGLFVFRKIVRRDYLKRGELSVFSSSLEFLVFLLHANLMYFFIPVRWPDLPRLSTGTVSHWVSLVLILIGLAIVFGSLIPLGYRRTMGLGSSELKTDGFYRLTRNPQLIGYYLLLFGFTVSYPSVYAIGWIVVFGAIAHVMTITEEEYLLKKYGAEYREYKSQVPRYLDLTGLLRDRGR